MNEKVSFKFRLGDKVKDLVSGYEGIIDMRKECLNGCIQYSVQASVKPKTSEMPTGYWLDEDQLKQTGIGLNKKPIKKSKTGGPMTKVER